MSDGYVNVPYGYGRFGNPAGIFARTAAQIAALPEFDPEAQRVYAFARTLKEIQSLPEVKR